MVNRQPVAQLTRAPLASRLQKMDMIAIIDYGMGNLRSVSKAFEAVGHQAVVTREVRCWSLPSSFKILD